MGSMMESKLTPEQHALIRAVLVAQTESLGVLETPVVEEILSRHRCRRVLDIGCGEGSFLVRLARGVQGAHFVGIDHSELAISDGLRRLRDDPVPNVELEAAFFDPSFAGAGYDAVLTRYTLQHASDPRGFVGAVFDRLASGGVFVAMESLDAYTDCHVDDPVWGRYRASIAAIHERVGSDANIGKALGRLLREAGFFDIQVRIVLCSPSTVGWERFRAVVEATAELSVNLFPDLFPPELFDRLTAWLDDRTGVERKDPYLSSAIANGTRS